MAKLNKNVIKALNEIAKTGRVSQSVGEPLLKQQLIEVNTNDVVDGLAAARLTDLAKASLEAPTPKSTNKDETNMSSSFAILTDVELPASKRGNRLGSGAPPKYPFATLEVGQSFFVPATKKMPNPLKTLGSTVAVANHKFSEPTGESKQVERTKRGPKNRAVLDANGNKVREVRTINLRKPLRKFSIRGVEKGKAYGKWTADEDGALIQRTL